VAREVDPLLAAGRDVVPNIGKLGDDLEDLQCQGIEVDDYSQPAPENTEPAGEHPNNGRFEKPTMCPRWMANINNAKGKFNSRTLATQIHESACPSAIASILLIKNRLNTIGPASQHVEE
jgi:hypothetical protein